MNQYVGVVLGGGLEAHPLVGGIRRNTGGNEVLGRRRWNEELLGGPELLPLAHGRAVIDRMGSGTITPTRSAIVVDTEPRSMAADLLRVAGAA